MNIITFILPFSVCGGHIEQPMRATTSLAPLSCYRIDEDRGMPQIARASLHLELSGNTFATKWMCAFTNLIYASWKI